MRVFLLSLVLLASSLSHAQTCPTPSQLATDLNAASQAAVISLSGVNPLNCPEISMGETWTGGKLIFADSPETPTQRGKLYEDTGLSYTSGTTYNRVFVYHVNGYSGSTKMKFAVLLKNTSGSSGTLTVQKTGTAGPSTSYLYAGKLAFQRWLQSTAETPVTVTAGQTVRLTTAIETLASPAYLMHGIYDYSFTQTHQITVCALDRNDDPVSVCPGLSVLSRDSHQRGTFPYADKVYDTASGIQIDTADGVQQLPVAAGSTNDTNAVGVDATDSSSQTLTGNYGVLYKMHLNTKASDSKKLGFLLNPRGGQWGGAQWAVAGITSGGKILIPDGSASTGDNTKGAVSGKYDPGSSFTVWVQWMPTGGSAMPLRFVGVPY
ncbi:MAG: hypothetical protein MUC88_00045 [Planctomycetes bacterium]|jgi:hypothetical protein|nr:hypothetical protein [Planctomycetota bacterium]